MNSVLIIAKEPSKAAEIESGLTHIGFVCSIIDGAEKLDEVLTRRPDVNLALVDMNGAATSVWGRSVLEQLQNIKLRRQLPVLAIFSKETLNGLDSDFGIDDFIVEPCDFSELAVRLRRAAKMSDTGAGGESIKHGDLVIDTAKCEVSISGRLIILTFKEYELLKFLMRHKSKVFTRDALLNEVWGFDYYGGDRTVDVHIRRLRSKIEDADHSFIETVRNIGYKFSS